MAFMTVSTCLFVLTTTLILLTFANGSRHGEKIHFQDSSESLGEQLDIDERSGRSHDNRNHRGRGRGHEKHEHLNKAEFEQGVPGLYPIKGPPQSPLMLSSHPGGAVGLQQRIAQQHAQTQLRNNLYATTVKYETPIFSTNNQREQQPLNHPYADNPFLSNIQIDVSPSSITNKNTSPPAFPAAPNTQLSKSEKPATTTPSYVNPRHTDLLYGSNLFEENENRESKTEDKTEVSFDERGLFYTEPRCQPGQILVKTKCRMAV